jgi:four helix bundle protein
MSNGQISRFEDFAAWQKARAVTTERDLATDEGRLARDCGLRDQMRRAAVPIMSNIADGFERGRPAEFHQFLSIAKASCAELRSHLYVARDVGHLDQPGCDRLMQQAQAVGRVLGGLRLAVEQRKSQAGVTHHS